MIAILLLGGCPQPCVGAACGTEYARAELRVYAGDDLVPGSWSFDAPTASALGEASLGREWVLAADGNSVYVGIPDGDQVRRLTLVDIESGTLQTNVVGASPDAAVLVGGASGSAFGAAVSVRVEADGSRTVLVGAPLAATGPTSGALGAVYRWSGLADGPRGELVASGADQAIVGTSAQARWGSGLAACADLDGDGVSDFLGTAGWGEGGGTLAGDVYLGLSASGGLDAVDVLGLSHLAYPVDGAEYGGALWCDGPLDRDEVADLVIGVPGALDPTGRLRTGAVELRTGGTALLGNPAARIYGELSGDRFGEALAVGDLNGDSLPDLVVGAPGVNGADANDVAGAVYVFLGRRMPSGSGLSVMFSVNAPEAVIRGVDPEGRLGTSVTVADLDGDGIGDLLAGAPGYNPGDAAASVQAGVVYVWRGSFGGWPEAPTVGSADAVLGGDRQYLRAGAVVSAGDLDGDGAAELLLRTWE